MAAAEWSGEADEPGLVERAKRDRAAFATIYRLHHQRVAAHIYRRTGDLHATEDLTSDVFLTALRTLPRYRYRGVPLRFWLLRIATNAVNRWAKRRRRGAIARLEADRLEDAASAPRTSDGGIDLEQAQAALLTIPPKFQAVLSLHYLEGLAVSETAVVLGCREGTVKSRLARARDALRDKLDKRR